MIDKNHSFDINVAQILKGHVQKAILLKEIFGWCIHNAKKGNNLRHGIVWTHNSASKLAEKFPYMPSSSIGRWLKELEKDSWVCSGNFNNKGYDRTKWYTIDFLRYQKACVLIESTINQNEKWVTQIGEWIHQNEKLINQIEQPIPSLTNLLPSLKTIEKEREESALSEISDLKSQLEKSQSEVERLKAEKEEKEKSSEKKESEITAPPTAEHDQGAKLKPVKKRDRKNWTSLDLNLHNFNLPDNWPNSLQEKVLEYWYYMEEKKGVNWGTKGTVSRQREAIDKHLKKFSDIQIIESLEETMLKGNVNYNPSWTINRKEKQKKDGQKQQGNKYSHLSVGESFKQALADGYYDKDDSGEDDSWARDLHAKDNEGAEQHFD